MHWNTTSLWLSTFSAFDFFLKCLVILFFSYLWKKDRSSVHAEFTVLGTGTTVQAGLSVLAGFTFHTSSLWPLGMVISSLHWHLHKHPYSQEDSSLISTKSIICHNSRPLWVGQLSFSAWSGRNPDRVVLGALRSSYWDSVSAIHIDCLYSLPRQQGRGGSSSAVLSR